MLDCWSAVLVWPPELWIVRAQIQRDLVACCLCFGSSHLLLLGSVVDGNRSPVGGIGWFERMAELSGWAEFLEVYCAPVVGTTAPLGYYPNTSQNDSSFGRNKYPQKKIRPSDE